MVELVKMFPLSTLVCTSAHLHICTLLVQQHHLIPPILFLPEYLYFLRDDGINGFAGIIRLYRQFAAVPAVDQHQQFHLGRPPEIHQGIQRSAYGATGIQHIVDQHYLLSFNGKWHVGIIGQVQAFVKIVAIEGDVEPAILQGGAVRFPFNFLDDTIRKQDAARLNADKGCLLELKMVFQYLVGEALDGQLDLLAV